MAAVKLDPDTIFTVLIYIFLSLLVIAIIYPLIYVVSASFSDPLALLNGEIWLLPIRPSIRPKNTWTIMILRRYPIHCSRNRISNVRNFSVTSEFLISAENKTAPLSHFGALLASV